MNTTCKVKSKKLSCEQNDVKDKPKETVINKNQHTKNGLVNGLNNTPEVISTNGSELDFKEELGNDPKTIKNATKVDTNDNISSDSREKQEDLSNKIVESDSKACCSNNQVSDLSKNLQELTLRGEIHPNLPPINYVQYESEVQMPMIMKIIQKDLSEPYSIYTYRYFIHNWPKLCFLAMCEDNCVGAIVCKLDVHRKVIKRGYIAMLAVDKNYRKLGIGSTLVRMAIQEMMSGDADEVVLETEVTNKPALQLYEALGFVRDKRLFRYYLNGVDALRLKLWLR